MATLLKTGIPNLMISVEGVYYGVRSINGKRSRVSFQTRLEREALEKLHDFMAADKHDLPTNRRIKCAQAFDEFITTGYGPRKKLAPATIKLYRELWTLYAVGELGNRRVVDVEPKHIIRVLDIARNKHGLSDTRLRNLYVTLTAFFQKTTMEPTRYTTINPVRHIGPENRPAAPESTRIGDEVVLTQNEIDRIADNFTQEPRRATGAFRPNEWVATSSRVLFLLLCYTGLRVSEAVALQIDDVLYLSGPVHSVNELPHLIEAKRQRNSEYRASDPNSELFAPLKGDVGKTEGKARRIPLSPFIARELGEYLQHGLASGHLIRGGLLFPNTVQKMMATGHVGKRIKAAAERAGITRYLTTHYTRHTYLSDLVENGVDIATAASFAGHGEQVLRARYAHRSLDSQVYAAAKAAGRQ